MVMEFRIIQPYEVGDWWEELYNPLAKAVNRPTSGYTMDNVKEYAETNMLSLLAVLEDGKVVAAMSAQIVPYPNETMLRIIHLGGSGIERWGSFLAESLAQLRDSLGADRVEAFCRKGFEKIFKEWGFVPTHTIMRSL